MQTKICSKCNVEKNFSDFYRDIRKSDGLYSKCKKCFLITNRESKKKSVDKIKKMRKLYYNNNKERELERVKSWQKNNKTYLNEKAKEKYDKEPMYKIKNNLRRRINQYVKNKNKKTVEILGCTCEFFKEHLEKQFLDGMSWDNYGFHGWHIDHIIPLSSAINEEEVLKLCHYTNLQPLWCKSNWSKGNKI